MFIVDSGFARFLRRISCGFIVIAASLLLAPKADAGLFTLTDNNSTAEFNTESSANAFAWRVDGTDHLFQQAFWYRVGNTAEQSVHSLPIAVEGATDTNFDGNDDTLFVRYNGQGFDITVRYSLDGGLPGSGASDMGEQISISNLGPSSLDFHFFQYVDFDLLGTFGGDSAVFTNLNTVRQYEGAIRLTETVVTPVPSHREINSFPITLDNLTDGLPTTLSDTPAIGTVFGPGDVTWAFQWDVMIPPNSTFQISKDKNLSAGVIPEPATLALLSLAAALGLCRRRKR